MSTTIGNRPAPTLQRAQAPTNTPALPTTQPATTEQTAPVKPGWVSGKSQAAARQQALVEAFGNVNTSRFAEVVAKANGLEGNQTALNAMANTFSTQGRAGVNAMVDAAMQKLEKLQTQQLVDAGFQRATEATPGVKALAGVAGATLGSATALAFGPVVGAGVGTLTGASIVQEARKVTASEVTGVMDRAIAQRSSNGKVDGLSAEQKKALATEFKAGFEKVSREHPHLVTTEATLAFLQQLSRLD